LIEKLASLLIDNTILEFSNEVCNELEHQDHHEIKRPKIELETNHTELEFNNELMEKYQKKYIDQEWK